MAKTKIHAAVLGDPIRHSLSPAIFKQLQKELADRGLQLSYQRKQVAPKSLVRVLDELRLKKDFVGCNVTVPHKEKTLAQLDFTESRCRTIGAVNVIKFQGQRIFGFNTDHIGVSQALLTKKTSVKGKRVVVLGAGGAAKSVFYVLGREQAKEVVILNRNKRRSASVLKKLKKKYPKTKWHKSLQKSHRYNLFVQCTPVGLKGKEDYPVDLEELFEFSQKGALAFDLVYGSGLTPFLQSAKKKKLRIVDGLPMLVGQALATFEIWFGPLTNKERLLPRITRKLRKIVR